MKAYRNWLRSLTVRLTLISAILIVGALTIFSYLVAEREVKTLAGELEKQAIALANNLAASTASYILVKDYTSLESVLVRAAEFPSIIDLQVVNAEGKLLGDVYRTEDGEIATRYDKNYTPPENITERLIKIQKDSMTVWQPVILGELVGWIRTSYTLNRIAEVKSQFWSHNILIGIVVAFITITLLFLYLRKPVLLIEQSTEFADTLDKDAGREMPVNNSYYELHRLAMALNRTSRNLHAKDEDLKQKILEQQQLTDELELRVLDRTKELSIARDHAIQANKSKSEFLANMSHEIRTPLTAIIGFSESLLDSDQSIDERIESINLIIRAGKHLLRVINEILDLSKIEANKIEVEYIPFSLFDVLSDVYSLIKLHAEEKGLNFKIDCEFPMPEVIKSDPVRLKQILINLCNNAIKFTKQGSVTVKVYCQCGEDKLIIKVIDTGIGLSPEQIAKLFKPFTQADASTTRNYGGTGLGLFLSKQLAERLGGDLIVESIVDVGSCFTLSINTGSLKKVSPVHQYANFDSHEAPQRQQHKQVFLSGRVLLAEDNVDNQRLVTLYLKRMGLQIDIANNGKEALDKLEAVKPDLILMDIQMPVMDGLTATKQLRELGYNGPIVALTASVMQQEQQECFIAGCNDICAKPIDQKDFIRVLSKHLDHSKPAPDSGPPIISTLLSAEPDMADLIREFVKKLPDMVEKVQTAYLNADYETLKAEVHTLKGTSGNFGYAEIFNLAKRIEFDIIANNHVAIDNLLQSLDAMIKRVEAGLVIEDNIPNNIHPFSGPN